jgi:alanine or glycine:cation symporter, AGCS family
LYLKQLTVTLEAHNGLSSAFWALAFFFTFYLKFPQIRYFKHAFKIVWGKFDKEGNPGDTSHFQALTTALSGTVGTGNIAGVALAIHLGGPAALFWMLVTAFLGMTTKFVEVTLSHKYREKIADGTMAGGPMYYMKHAEFKFFGKKVNLMPLAVVFAIATIFSSFGTGSLPQIRSIAESMFVTFGLQHIITGAVLSILLALVIIGGIKRIARVTSRLVPIMAIIYFIGAFLVIVYNYENIVPSLVSIFTNVFTGTAAVGGFLGAGFMFAFNRGVNRGLFSNEAGQGSAPIAHASARANNPVSEGMVSILEPFADTIVICFLTGMVLLTSGVWTEKIDNQFDITDITIMQGNFKQSVPDEKKILFDHINNTDTTWLFSGPINVVNGRIQDDVTMLHARSVAENTTVYKDNKMYSGTLFLKKGKLFSQQNVIITGKSLLHSAPLTTEAFKRSFLGPWGQYIVSIGLLLFAFSTAISWSYYGDRAVTFLWGAKAIIYFRIIYIFGFFIASVIDTKIIWTFSGITIALMTLPNLIGIFWLHKEMKITLKNYWVQFKQNFPNEPYKD